MNEWILIEPRKGKRPDSQARVTLAWRKSSQRGPEALTGYVNVAKLIASELGWPEKGWLELAHDPAGTMLRVRLSDAGYRVSQTHGCATFQASLPWVEADKRPAEAVRHQVLPDGVLLITLPDWAKKPAAAEMPPAALEAAAKPPSPPAPPIARPVAPPAKADDKKEAMQLLEAGMSARQVAEEMGLGLSVVSNWAAEVRARKQGKAA
jgi:pyruvate/2-oxoglutarate dehydrogenase complex dihydrolipoamide acyltransferase (E2) component